MEKVFMPTVALKPENSILVKTEGYWPQKAIDGCIPMYLYWICTLIFVFKSLMSFFRSDFLRCFVFHLWTCAGRSRSKMSWSSTCITTAASGKKPRSPRNWASSGYRGKPSRMKPVELGGNLHKLLNTKMFQLRHTQKTDISMFF